MTACEPRAQPFCSVRRPELRRDAGGRGSGRLRPASWRPAHVRSASPMMSMFGHDNGLEHCTRLMGEGKKKKKEAPAAETRIPMTARAFSALSSLLPLNTLHGSLLFPVRTLIHSPPAALSRTAFRRKESVSNLVDTPRTTAEEDPEPAQRSPNVIVTLCR